MIDASKQHGGTPIADAMVAARAFAAKRHPTPSSASIVFNGDVKTLLEPTTDPELIKAALAAPPKLGEGTKINDALVQARDVLTSTGATSLRSSSCSPTAPTSAARARRKSR